jgi:hypothetical protein
MSKGRTDSKARIDSRQNAAKCIRWQIKTLSSADAANKRSGYGDMGQQNKQGLTHVTIAVLAG